MIDVGIDLVEISRIKKSIENPRFIERIFSHAEIDYFKEKNYSPQTIAANFSAKEAFSKAIGTGIRGFGFKDVQVLRNESGKPYLKLLGEAKRIADELGLEFSVSLTHTKEYASSVVISYSKNIK